MAKALYRGFTTTKAALNPRNGFQTTNIETVNRDLLNHIYTAKGERVMHPSFGTRIPLLAFEPLDDKTVKIIEDDLRDVVNFDPRVELIELSVLAMPNSNAVAAFMDIRYLELDVIETLKLEIAVGT